MLGYVKDQGSPNQQRFTWIIEAFVEEALQEMADGTPEQTAAFFEELSRLIHWVATGELDGIATEELTSGFRPLAYAAITAGDQDEAAEALLEVEDAASK